MHGTHIENYGACGGGRGKRKSRRRGFAISVRQKQCRLKSSPQKLAVKHKRTGWRTLQELADYDAIILVRQPGLAHVSQMRTFPTKTGGLWVSGALYGKLRQRSVLTGNGEAP